MYLYRVDKRYFEVGAEIQPQTNFEQYMDEESMKVENILNANRPDQIPLRKDCLFLFFELSAALNFFRKYGGYVYEVEVDCHDIYHRGDMNKLDNLLDLVRFTDEVDILTAAGNEYWKGGTHTFMPCYEFLVKSCIVRKCLVEPSELKSFTDNFEITKSIERTDLYLHTLENINSPLQMVMFSFLAIVPFVMRKYVCLDKCKL